MKLYELEQFTVILRLFLGFSRTFNLNLKLKVQI